MKKKREHAKDKITFSAYKACIDKAIDQYRIIVELLDAIKSQAQHLKDLCNHSPFAGFLSTEETHVIHNYFLKLRADIKHLIKKANKHYNFK